MTITWGFGLRGIATPGDDAHRRLLLAIWEESGRSVLRDAHGRAVFEVSVDGVVRETPAEQASLIAAAIAQVGTYLAWSTELAASFHFDVGSIGVPWLVRETLRVELPIAGPSTLQFVRDQYTHVLVDAESELLEELGLTPSSVYRMNEAALRLADLAVDHDLLMAYG